MPRESSLRPVTRIVHASQCTDYSGAIAPSDPIGHANMLCKGTIVGIREIQNRLRLEIQNLLHKRYSGNYYVIYVRHESLQIKKPTSHTPGPDGWIVSKHYTMQKSDEIGDLKTHQQRTKRYKATLIEQVLVAQIPQQVIDAITHLSDLCRLTNCRTGHWDSVGTLSGRSVGIRRLSVWVGAGEDDGSKQYNVLQHICSLCERTARNASQWRTQ